MILNMDWTLLEMSQRVYDSTANQAITGNVYLVSSKDLKLDATSEVEFKKTFVNLAISDSKLVSGEVIRATPELLEHYRTFWFDI